MNGLLFERSSGGIGAKALARFQSTQLLHSTQPAPNLRFDGGESEVTRHEGPQPDDTNGGVESVPKIWAHQAGVNALAVDSFESRLMLSGGADSSIKVWDLEKISSGSKVQVLKPLGVVPKNASAHKFGITHLSFYPFDSGAFLSSSYDHTLKLYSTENLSISASFDLDSIIYTHALSPIASHLLVACATQHPAIRLIDLRSGSSAHSLAGHRGALLSVAWSPTNEYILASGGTDGTARVWDIRKSAGNIGQLDMEDSIGVVGHDGMGLGARTRVSSKAHTGAVNGITWTDDGAYIITSGHDERVRVWDATTGANTLASFGPTLRNANLSNLPLLSSPVSITPPGKGVLIYPNEHEILVFELHEGRLLKRMKVPGPVMAVLRSRTGERNMRNRITSLAWRGAAEGICSGHSDGQIRAWIPRTIADDDADADEDPRKVRDMGDDSNAQRKRKVLDDVFKDLTGQKITFG